MFDARHADCVGAYPVDSLQMLRMHEKPCKFVFIKFQTEEHTEPHVVDTALHSAVHCLGMVIVIVFRPGGMQL